MRYQIKIIENKDKSNLFLLLCDKEHDSFKFLQIGFTLAKLWPLLFVIKFFEMHFCMKFL